MRFETSLDSPLGPIRIVASDLAITEVAFGPTARSDRQPILDRAVDAIRSYFAGVPLDPELPLAPMGTPFQQSVWAALQSIAPGETRTYADIARRLGRPTATRAVGAANGRNPIAILVPCHRVIGSDGTLTGYAGGLARKEWLLAHEARFRDRRVA